MTARPGPRTVARHGKPAEAVPHAGMPSYESENGTLFVMESLIVVEGAPGTMLMPWSYPLVSARFPGGPVALHDGSPAVRWRPLVYQVHDGGPWRLGSQMELEWRWGYVLAQMDVLLVAAKLTKATAKADPWEQLDEAKRFLVEHTEGARLSKTREDANERAMERLRAHLNAQQRIDLARWGNFFVRGRVNRLYGIELDNGASIVDPVTRVPVAAICLHPEAWTPAADVALATKLLIDSGNERELLEAGRTRWRAPARKPSRDELKAAQIEALRAGEPVPGRGKRAPRIVRANPHEPVLTDELREMARRVGDSIVDDEAQALGGIRLYSGSV